MPRFYLEGFTSLPSGRRNPCVFVFDKEQGRCYPRSPEEVWKLANYYDIQGVDGEPDDVLDRVNREVETKASPLFKEGSFLARRAWPDAKERALLAWFAGMLEVRGPELHDLMGEFYVDAAMKGLIVSQHNCKGRPEVFESAVRSIEAQLGVRITGATLEDVSQAKIEPGMDAIKVGFFQTMDVPQRLFGRMPWTILVAQGDDVFITSDRPLIRENLSPLGRPGFLVDELNEHGFSYILPLTQKFAVATHLELGGKDRGFVAADTKLVTMVNAEVWGRAPRYRFAPREDFTGRDVIAGLERLNHFLTAAVAALSEEAQHIAHQIPHELSHSSVEEAEKAAADILQDPSWRLELDDIQQVLGFIDLLIANLSWLPRPWAVSLPWWRRRVVAFQQQIQERSERRGDAKQ